MDDKKKTEVGGQGTSLAVRQWVDFARGKPVHPVHQDFRVECVRAEERYCLACYGVRWFDVVEGPGVAMSRCRCCGMEQ